MRDGHKSAPDADDRADVGHAATRPAGLYGLKPEVQRALRPLVMGLVARRVSADALTLAAIPVAAIGGICLALAEWAPGLLLAVPFLAALRLVLNLLDGQVARATGTSHPLGELLNEVGDRVADVLFIGGLAFVTAVGPMLGLAAVVAALLASYMGITARAVGAGRQYGGPMSKPGRMLVLAAAAPISFVTASTWPLLVAAVIILVGSLLTLIQRLMASRRAMVPVEGEAA